MSTNGNGWAPRKPIEVTCPSGKKVMVQRPGPEFLLRSGRVARTFSRSLSAAKKEEGQSLNDYGLEIIAQMSDEELAELMVFAKKLVCTMLISPKLVLNPRAGMDEIGPDDVPSADFWHLWSYGMENFIGIKVPVADTEVEVADLETFRGEPGIQGDGVDSVHVSVAEPERAIADQGLVDSTGT